MADKENKQRKNTDSDSDVAEVTREFLALFGRFFLDLSKLTAKTAWKIMRNLGQRGRDKASEKISQTAEDSKARVTDLFSRKASQTVPDHIDEAAPSVDASPRFVDTMEDSDPEAAALLEDLLQETARNLQSKPAPTAQPEPDRLDVPTDTTTAPMVEATQSVVDLELLDDESQSPAVIDVDAEPETEITYNTPTEKTRLEEQLRAREALIKEELTVREQSFDVKEARQERLREAVKADMARIREEQRQREERFAQAEAERKRHESERLDAMKSGSRLQDDEPETPNTSIGDDNASQTGQSSES